ncbi:OprD family outer membrane porin, partial [Pseudomonas sp.]|uniref:OprD family outer membrane porin n=1 Tax=Pseudomonas sp. TaxID=306 RepID=UPI003A97272F
MVLLGCSSLAAFLPMTASAEGFVDDAKVNLNLRNFYINRNFTNPDNAQGKAEEWTQSFILDAKSGFTQGVVGFGIDGQALVGIHLDGGKGHHPDNNSFVPSE